MNHGSEEELIAQAVAGDELAVQQLLMLHHDAVAAVLDKKIPAKLRGVLAAEDVRQEAYIVVVRELSTFQPRGENSFFRWVLTIAERKLIDAIRALRAAKRGGGRKALDLPLRSDTTSVVALLEQVAFHERTPSQSAASHELAFAIDNALAELKEDYRTAVRCRYIEGLSVAQTAARMGRTEGAVVMLCQRGLERLAERLGNASRFFGPEA